MTVWHPLLTYTHLLDLHKEVLVLSDCPVNQLATSGDVSFCLARGYVLTQRCKVDACAKHFSISRQNDGPAVWIVAEHLENVANLTVNQIIERFWNLYMTNYVIERTSIEIGLKHSSCWVDWAEHCKRMASLSPRPGCPSFEDDVQTFPDSADVDQADRPSCNQTWTLDLMFVDWHLLLVITFKAMISQVKRGNWRSTQRKTEQRIWQWLWLLE